MEIHHRSDKRDRERKKCLQGGTNASVRNFRSGRTSRPENKAHHHIQNYELESGSQYHKPPAPLRKESLPRTALSGDDEYVRSWLLTTGADLHLNVASSVAWKKTSSRQEEYINRKSRSDSKSFIQVPLDTSDADVPSKRKRRHHSSSDSSLLEAPANRRVPLEVENIKSRSEQIKEGDSSHQHKRCKKYKVDISGPVAEDISIAQSSPRQDIFEKRKRYKTREDRYDSRKTYKEPRKDDGERRSRSKKEKKGGQRKSAKKAGEDLMNNFASKSIGQERLTIRPCHGPGLFMNGRASSPAKRRGVPDLAFSEMDFLQHSSRHASATNDRRTKSKSKEKQKRNVSKAQNEISTFFKSIKTPLGEVEPSRVNVELSDAKRHQGFIDFKRIKSAQHQKSHSRSPSFNISENHYLRFGEPKPLSEINSQENATTIKYLKKAPGSVSKQSERAMSYISWSETQISLGTAATSKPTSHISRRKTSPTPDSIRRSIISTRIFRDTGIEAHVDLNHSRDQISPNVEASQAFIYPNKGFRDPVSIATPGTNSSETQPRYSRSHNQANTQEGGSSHLEPNSHEQDTAEGGLLYCSNASTNIQNGMTTDGLMLESLGKVSAWSPRPSSRTQSGLPSATPLTTETLHASKITPLNREQLAKSARIKRPSTTLPTNRLPKKDPLPNGNGSMARCMQDSSLGICLGAAQFAQASEAERPNSAPLCVSNDSERDPLTLASNAKIPTIQNSLFTNSNSISNQSYLGAIDNRAPAPSLVQQAKTDPALQIHSTNRANNTKTEDPSNRYPSNLPTRGSWIGRSSMASLPACLSPMLEAEQFFMRQMHRETAFNETLTCHEPQADSPQIFATEYQDPLDASGPPYFENLSSNRVDEDEQYSIINGQVNEEVDQILCGNYQEAEIYLAGENAEHGAWQQHEDQNLYKVEEAYRTWDSDSRELYGQTGLARNLQDGYSFDMSHQQPNNYDDINYQEDVGMQGFWKSRRQY